MKDLDKYIEKLRSLENNKPLLNSEDIRNLADSSSKNYLKKLRNNIMKILTFAATVSLLTYFAFFSGIDFDANTEYSMSKDNLKTEDRTIEHIENSGTSAITEDRDEDGDSTSHVVQNINNSNIEKHLNVRHLSIEDFKEFNLDLDKDKITFTYETYKSDEFTSDLIDLGYTDISDDMSVSKQCTIEFGFDGKQKKIITSSMILPKDSATKRWRDEYTPVALYGELKDKRWRSNR
jgi:hypothetical protein